MPRLPFKATIFQTGRLTPTGRSIFDEQRHLPPGSLRVPRLVRDSLNPPLSQTKQTRSFLLKLLLTLQQLFENPTECLFHLRAEEWVPGNPKLTLEPISYLQAILLVKN